MKKSTSTSTSTSKRRKLSLTKSVIRSLDNLQLREVVGGNVITGPGKCGS